VKNLVFKKALKKEPGITMAVITISRQYGSGGEEIAHQVAKTLGYDYMDKELIVAVAQEAHTEESEVSQFDEQGQHPVIRFLKQHLIGEHRVIRTWPTYYWSDEFEELLVREGKTDISSISSRRLFESVIRELGERGNVVIVGRGAGIVLAELPSVLTVRITTPLEYRLQRIMAEQSLNSEEALNLIKQTDKQRTRYIKQGYGVNWDNPKLYQLVLDMGKIGEETAIRIICEAVHGLDIAKVPTDTAVHPTILFGLKPSSKRVF